MSIASNVLSLNSNLTTARTNLKRLLENHGIVYHDDDNVFTLAKRAWFLVYPTNRISGGSYSEEAVVGEAVDLYVYMEDDDETHCLMDVLQTFTLALTEIQKSI